MEANIKIPQEQELLSNLGKIAYTLDKAYLSKLYKADKAYPDSGSDYGVLPFDKSYNKDEDDLDRVTYSANIRVLEVTRWVYDKEEKIEDCFKNVVSVFAASESSIALVVHRTPKGARTFFVMKNAGAGRNEDSKNDIGLLNDALCGNFPGTRTTVVDARETEKFFNFASYRSIAALCNVPSEKSEGYISQGLDKLLNGIVPKSDNESYYVVILAESLSQGRLRDILNGYQELATAITPFIGYQFQAGQNETEIKGEMESLSHSENISRSITKTHSVNVGVFLGIPGLGLGVGGGYGYNWGNAETEGTTETRTKGTNHSISLGTSKSSTYTYKSYAVTGLIEKLEATIKRINESQSNGLWKCASYVLAQEAKTSRNIANYLRSITQGDQSYIEPSFINAWFRQGGNDKSVFGESIKYLSRFCHPVFVNGADGIAVNHTMNLSTTELSHLFAFPRHSVQGLPVVECARFGREPHALDRLEKDIDIGCAYHMHMREQNNRVFLSREELKKHTFVTGSTGSGKSNTVCKLLADVCLSGDDAPTFLVVEPAKGEYKDVFGGLENVTVYGTNPFKAPNLLQINPFAFPEDVHVLEHIDRLVEVFNACWPMYAAMPAILREAVEKAYESIGWNLRTSAHIGSFPTFDTLMEMLPGVIDASSYSADTSSDYKGALLTRVRSLTTGIQGQIFGHDTDAQKLFNENVIVDISRVGSTETKALIMGVLVLKLQEFRMSEPGERNSKLKHITVLEEAHNLLRRTASEQTQESSNLQGKSVEMLANAIAEMRTYGEGFVIADQSPGLMDMAAIRNTNTKIILRLLDESDRILVGRAAGLSDNQIGELSKLRTGVAAITQSGWLEPVLCLVDEYKGDKKMSERFGQETFEWHDDENDVLRLFLNNAFDVERSQLAGDAVDKVRKWADRLNTTEKVRAVIETALSGKPLSGMQQMVLIGGLFRDRLKTIPDRETAISEVQRCLMNRFDFVERDEVLRRIDDLFLVHFPANIYTDMKGTPERVEGSVL